MIFIVFIAFAVSFTPLWAAPKKDNPGSEKGHKPDKGNKGKAYGRFKERKQQIKLNLIQDKIVKEALRTDKRDVRIQGKNRVLFNLNKALKKLRHARWFYNPNDARGQGNMGKPDMLDPYGHDKDSDRKELYGSNGRVVKLLEPEPEPEPDPDPDPDPEPIPDPYPLPMSVSGPDLTATFDPIE